MDRDELLQKLTDAISDKSAWHAAEAVFDVIEKAGLEIVKKQDAVQSGDSRNENSWISRWDASFPYQNWYAFHDDDIVDVMNNNGEMRTSRAGDLWWGYEHEMGGIADGVIVKARYSKRPIEERSDTASPRMLTSA